MITSLLHRKLIKILLEDWRLNIAYRYKMKGRKAVVILLPILLLLRLKHQDVKSVKKKVQQQNGLDFVFVPYVVMLDVMTHLKVCMQQSIS
jgi:hypothetical protein